MLGCSSENRSQQRSDDNRNHSVNQGTEQTCTAGSESNIERFLIEELVCNKFFADIQNNIGKLTENTGSYNFRYREFSGLFAQHFSCNIGHRKFKSESKGGTCNELRNGEIVQHGADSRSKSSGNRSQR